MSEPGFRAGFAELARRGLSFDAWVYHHQLPGLRDLCRSRPEVPVVVDHLGGPLAVGPYAGRRESVRAAWRAALTDLARVPSVHVKLGGIGFPLMIEPSAVVARRGPEARRALAADGLDPDAVPPTSGELAAHWAEDVRWVIELFGVDRCMFESNFPVDRVTCSYRVLWNTYKRIVADASADEKAALFRGTARAVYRIPVPPPAPPAHPSPWRP
ncbi:amidohydrolase family protein [Actinacidiphila reveromycinica]|uniref:amidohydrolase family protein n=1 Tax=Actinacidiphila reveromycinica TaxID=659352 RepID=UPI0019238559|nr:amidohydrolase family protein [Streptomyces sp. SN-593]